jgi:DNA-binding transcriptional LysR family regulator
MNLVTCLNNYIELVDNNNYRSTAKILGISPSTLSKQVMWLEKIINCQLILRTTRKFFLTPEGENFYHSAQNLVDIWQQTTDGLNTNKENIKGTLRIGFPLVFADSIMPIVSEFSNAYPKIKIILLRVPTLQKTKVKNLNCFFGYSSERSLVPGWKSKNFADYDFGMYVSPDYFENHPQLSSINDLHEHNCFINMSTSNPFRWTFKSGKVKVNGNLISGLAPLLVRAATLGTGIVYLPSYCVSNHLEQGSLINVLPDENYQESIACLFYPKEKNIILMLKFTLSSFTFMLLTWCQCVPFIFKRIIRHFKTQTQRCTHHFQRFTIKIH